MKIKNIILLFLTSIGFMTACSNNEIDNNSNPAITKAGEVQIVISGTGESVDYTKATTRGIASESENQIDNLSIYLFAGTASGSNDYILLEKWTSALTSDQAQKHFTLQPAGSEWKASVFPKECIGRTYLKLYCIANHGNSSHFEEDGTTPITLTEAVLDDTNALTNAAAVTSEADFLAAFTAELAADQIIRTPLVMTGFAENIKMAGSVSKVKVDLTRAVARFDIDNTARTSNFIIQGISLKQARKTSPLWSGNPTAVADPSQPSALLMETHTVDFTQFDHSNEGVTESVIYVNPSLATDLAHLALSGLYINPVSGVQTPHTYHVNIQRTDAGTTTPVAILRNNRYKLRIIDVTQTVVNATFEIEDWVNDGGIDVKPDNAAPVFDAATGITPVGGTPTTPVLRNLPYVNSYTVAADGTFDIVVTASGRSNVQVAPLFPNADCYTWPDWLTVTPSVDGDFSQKDGLTYSTFHVEKTAGSQTMPIKLTFKNDAASVDDPDLETVVTFYGSESAPFMSNIYLNEAGVEQNIVCSAGNSVDPVAGEFNMIREVGSSVQVVVICPEGIVTPDIPAGFSMTRKALIDGFSWLYTFRITNAANVNNPVFSFINAADPDPDAPTLDAEITFNLTAPTAKIGLPFADNRATVLNNGSELQLDIDAMELNPSSLVTAAVYVPFGSTVTLPVKNDDLWLDINAPNGTAANIDNMVTLTFSPRNGYPLAGSQNPHYANISITVRNNVTGSDETLTISRVPVAGP